MEQAVVKILLLGICGYGSNYIKEISERDIPGIKIEGICEVVPNAADLYPIIKEQNIPIYQTPEDFYKEHTADLAVVSTPIHLHYSQIVTVTCPANWNSWKRRPASSFRWAISSIIPAMYWP